LPRTPDLHFLQFGSSQRRRPPPWAMHLCFEPTDNFSQPVLSQRRPPPWATHLPVGPFLDFPQPGSLQRWPPPWAIHLWLAPTARLLQPDLTQRWTGYFKTRSVPFALLRGASTGIPSSSPSTSTSTRARFRPAKFRHFRREYLGIDAMHGCSAV